MNDDEQVTVHHGDCLDVLRGMADNSIDAVCTDPPYGLGFMGKEWDSGKSFVERKAAKRNTFDHVGGNHNPVDSKDSQRTKLKEGRAFGEWCEQWAAECLRVLKPGGHLLAFGGTRTWHRLAVAVEDAGFEVRDSIAWLYGSGFPKSLDVSKAIDKTAGAEREVVGTQRQRSIVGSNNGWKSDESYAGQIDLDITAPATPAAQQWQGWGTALKPAHEPVVVARKPLVTSGILTEIGSHLDRLESEWQALAADPTTPIGRAAGSFAPTGTSPSEPTDATGSNTVSSWRVCWAELCSLLSTSTTATASSTTTDLRTLSSCLGKLTATSIRASETNPPGSTSIASAADHLFASVVCGLRATLALSATEPATAATPLERQAAGATYEPIVVARKPLGVGTVAANVLAHGTGALNVDGCRVAYEEGGTLATNPSLRSHINGGNGGHIIRSEDERRVVTPSTAGRWPANVLLDGDAAAELDEQSGTLKSGGTPPRRGADKDRVAYGTFAGNGDVEQLQPASAGGASRFFPVFRYQAKAPTRERPSYFRPTCDCEDAWPTTSRPRDTSETATPDGCSMSRSGNLPTGDPSPTDGRSTTSTATSGTTTPTTSSPAHLSPISAFTPGANSATVSGGSPAESAASSSPSAPTTGISPAKGGRPTVAVGPATSPSWSATSVCGECGAPTRRESHATVKPLALMRWLCRLVGGQPGSVILDPFAGSGTTIEAAILEGFRVIGIEREADYLPLIEARIQRQLSSSSAVKLDAAEALALFDIEEPA